MVGQEIVVLFIRVRFPINSRHNKLKILRNAKQVGLSWGNKKYGQHDNEENCRNTGKEFLIQLSFEAVLEIVYLLESYPSRWRGLIANQLGR